MRIILATGLLALAFVAVAGAAEKQGVIADWNCVQSMVKDGREKTLRNNKSCSMSKNYDRVAYGLITDDLKFYRLEDPDNRKIKQMLKDTLDKDNLKVVVSGDLQGNTIKVTNITEL